jgi:hypothetical protein
MTTIRAGKSCTVQVLVFTFVCLPGSIFQTVCTPAVRVNPYWRTPCAETLGKSNCHKARALGHDTVRTRSRTLITAARDPAISSTMKQQHKLSDFLLLFTAIMIFGSLLIVSKDHTTMTAPLPVCSAKLSIVGLG